MVQKKCLFECYLGVGFGVLEQVQDKLAGLGGPTGHGHTERLRLGSATNTAVEATERNGLLVLLNILEVSQGLGQLHARDGSGDLTGVLEVNTEVGAARQGS